MGRDLGMHGKVEKCREWDGELSVYREGGREEDVCWFCAGWILDSIFVFVDYLRIFLGTLLMVSFEDIGISSSFHKWIYLIN